jgi:RluA family pseudouridine synthase
MARPNSVELPDCKPMPILYEDRSALAIDKPRGWMLVPHTWQKTSRNLQAAITSSITGGDFWARSRGLKFLRYVHRLDADTSGVLLFAKSMGAVESLSELFEGRRMEKTYLAVVVGAPRDNEWSCHLKIAPNPHRVANMMVDEVNGKPAETHFKVLDKNAKFTLVEARPITGRTHQIRIHLAEAGLPILGDEIYGKYDQHYELALRSVRMAYVDPFTRKRVEIQAPTEWFLKEYSFRALAKALHKKEKAGGNPVPPASPNVK